VPSRYHHASPAPVSTHARAASPAQSELYKMVFGAKFWQSKKSGYSEQRDLARKARDLGMLGGGESDPVALQVRRWWVEGGREGGALGVW
jgi:hypothetical protein